MQTSSPCRGASQSEEPQGGLPCTVGIRQIKKRCSVRGGQPFSTSSWLPSSTGEREAQVRPDLRPHPGRKANGICSPQRITPPKKHRHPFLEN